MLYYKHSNKILPHRLELFFMNIITHFHSVHNTTNSYTYHNSWFGSRTGHIAIKSSRAPPEGTNKKPHPGGHPDTANAKPTSN